jgi:hypothetical protein
VGDVEGLLTVELDPELDFVDDVEGLLLVELDPELDFELELDFDDIV